MLLVELDKLGVLSNELAMNQNQHTRAAWKLIESRRIGISDETGSSFVRNQRNEM